MILLFLQISLLSLVLQCLADFADLLISLILFADPLIFSAFTYLQMLLILQMLLTLPILRC